jgi:hypothetical protein
LEATSTTAGTARVLNPVIRFVGSGRIKLDGAIRQDLRIGWETTKSIVLLDVQHRRRIRLQQAVDAIDRSAE